MAVGIESLTRTTGTGSAAFLDWLEGWLAGLQTLDLAQYLAEQSKNAEQVAAISADLVVGFCYEGPLASPRIADIVEPSAALLTRAHSLGVRDFVLVQEYHTHEATEFAQFGPHCIRGTREADTVDALANLPFADLFRVVRKNSLHPALDTDLDAWLVERPTLDTFLAVGDCTDLCLYQLAMHLKLGANATDRPVDVIVPADCVQTYDLPVQIAQNIGAMPHDGDLMHSIFLYHLALNGVRVVKNVV